MAPIKPPLTLLPKTAQSRKLSEQEKFEDIKREIVRGLKLRIEMMRDEASVMHADMEAALSRLKWNGLDANLNDIKTATWYRVATELKVFQEFAKRIRSLEGPEADNT